MLCCSYFETLTFHSLQSKQSCFQKSKRGSGSPSTSVSKWLSSKICKVRQVGGTSSEKNCMQNRKQIGTIVAKYYFKKLDTFVHSNFFVHIFEEMVQQYRMVQHKKWTNREITGEEISSTMGKNVKRKLLVKMAKNGVNENIEKKGKGKRKKRQKTVPCLLNGPNDRLYFTLLKNNFHRCLLKEKKSPILTYFHHHLQWIANNTIPCTFSSFFI